MESNMTRVTNLMPSPMDNGDLYLGDFNMKADPLPPEFFGFEPPKVKDQGTTSMCVAFAGAYMKQAHEFKEKGVVIDFSEGYLYGIRDGGHDGEGLYIRDFLKILRKYGVPYKSDFPMTGTYQALRDAIMPQIDVLAAKALSNTIRSYARLRTKEDMKRAIVENGGFLLGIYVYESFFNVGNDGIVKDIISGEKNYGGHGMYCHGYTTINGREYIYGTNSWGDGWGKGGRFYIPMDYKGIYEAWTAVDAPLMLNQETKMIMYLNDKNIRVIKNDVLMNLVSNVAPFVVEGNTVLPLRFIAENLGFNVEWIPEYKCIVLSHFGSAPLPLEPEILKK